MSFQPLNQNLEQTQDDYSGVYFLGKVISNKDPLNLDRIKATVPGLYDDSTGELPWIGPIKSSPFGQGAGWGVHGSPAVGSDVVIRLQNGDTHHPVYQHIKTKADSEFPSGTTWGFRDSFGNKFRCISDGFTEIVLKAGVSITVSPDGVLSLVAKGDINARTDGNLNLESVGETNITAASLNVSGNTTFEDNVHINGGLGVDGTSNMSGHMSVGTISSNGTNIGSTHKHPCPDGITGDPF